MNALNRNGDFRGRPHPTLYELIDKDGVRVATFTPPCLAEIAAYAKARWPDQEQDEDRTGRGWDVQVVGAE